MFSRLTPLAELIRTAPPPAPKRRDTITRDEVVASSAAIAAAARAVIRAGALRRGELELDVMLGPEQPKQVQATCEGILRAARKARGEITEPAPTLSEVAKMILRAGAKRRGET
jgi:hypothetical protein